MSRIIVKNLPLKISEQNVRKIFEKKGCITELNLKFTNAGVFRQFAFIGYKTAEEAAAARDHFHETFVNTSKIKVEICRSFNDPEKPKAWSKHSKNIPECKGNGDISEVVENKEDKKRKRKLNEAEQKSKKSKLDGFPEELRNDQKFLEFLQVNKGKGEKPVWADYTAEYQPEEEEENPPSGDEKKENHPSGDMEEEESLNNDDEDQSPPKKHLSNMEYFKSKMESSEESSSKSKSLVDGKKGKARNLQEKMSSEIVVKNLPKKISEGELREQFKLMGHITDITLKYTKNGSFRNMAFIKYQTEEEAAAARDNFHETFIGVYKIKVEIRRAIGEAEYAKIDNSADKSEVIKNKKEAFDDKFTVKLRNLHHSCQKKHVKAFFKNLKIVSFRFQTKCKGFAYVKFENEKDMNMALNKNRSYLEGHMILVKKYIQPGGSCNSETKPNKNYETDDAPEEAIAESGRIFVRNLCYSVTEEELKELFSKYGPLVEIQLPVDFHTKVGIGIAFVSYMLPEHAVNAYVELDRSDFQGRLLHLLPARPKRESAVDTDDSFQGKKKAKLNALKKSPGTWNSLFLGMNAVADVIAERRNISKADLLSNDAKGSLPVRMAKAETELVMETREFLLRNGVKLDSFSQANAERSKTVLIAKDLPAQTSPKELNELFSKYSVTRIVFPSSAITALVEFQDEVGARAAFNDLTFTEFHHHPLYLEWAPMAVFDPNVNIVENETQVEEKEAATVSDAPEETEESEDEPEEGTTLYVKNINYATTDESFRMHFEQCGPVYSATISKKPPSKSGVVLSFGFGFVRYKHRSSAAAAMIDLQSTKLDDHSLELKYCNRESRSAVDVQRKKQQYKKQNGTKILVRNIPFECTQREVRELFQEYGDLKTVRLPKKTGGESGHRGFAFVDFVTKNAAKRAFETLCHSTHLLGRRMNLEWADADAEDVNELQKKTARDYYGAVAVSQKAVTKTKLLDDVKLYKPDDDDDDE